MTPGVYKHIRNTDVAIRVIRAEPKAKGDTIAIVIWLNVVNPSNIFPIWHEVVAEFITQAQLPNWERIGD